MPSIVFRHGVSLGLCAVIFLSVSRQVSAATPIAGDPTYDPSTQTGYLRGEVHTVPGTGVNDAGTAVGSAEKYTSGADTGARAVRWDIFGAATELASLPGNLAGYRSEAYSVNADGTAVGYLTKFDPATHQYVGDRAVRWSSSGIPTELGNIGTARSGFTTSNAYAINTAGTTVGYAYKYDSAGNGFGWRAVRWDASGTTTGLGDLGTDSLGVSDCAAYAISNAGTIVGYAEKYTNHTYLGRRAVRWDALGTTELGDLGTDVNGRTNCWGLAVNTLGTTVGRAEKFTAGTYLGERAVRWDAVGTVATELGNLGTDSTGNTFTEADAINTAGTAVGGANKYDVGGNDIGTRAVRWDATGTAATELGNLGTTLGANPNGTTISWAYAINTDGIAVGRARTYNASGTEIADHAVAWGADGVAFDLNNLIDPSSGWVLLKTAEAISDTNFIAGLGSYDPDGAGPLAAYDRLYVLQLPEPAAGAILIPAVVMLLKRRRERTAGR